MSATIPIKVKRTNPASSVPLPQYMTPHAAAMDLYADIVDPVVIEPGERRLISTGICLELPDGYEAQIRPRSGLALHHGLTVLNSPGTGDPDFRGIISVLLINHGHVAYTVSKGERIAQMVISSFVRVNLVEVEELSETERGDGGFGHTGK